MKRRILGIHGIFNYQKGMTASQAAASIGEKWTRSLGEPVDVVYYADLLQRPVRQSAHDQLGPLPVGAAPMLEEWATDLGVPQDVIAMGRATQFIRTLVSLITEHTKLSLAVVEPFIGTFLREVAGYLNDPGARQAVRSRVSDAIITKQPDLVIGHSLGSVVGYEAIFSSPTWRGNFLSLGSPLAMSYVFSRLEPAPVGGRATRPPTVTRWDNVADCGDFVAVPPRLAGRFEPDRNPPCVSIHPLAFHDVQHYLSARVIQDTIADLLDHPSYRL